MKLINLLLITIVLLLLNESYGLLLQKSQLKYQIVKKFKLYSEFERNEQIKNKINTEETKSIESNEVIDDDDNTPKLSESMKEKLRRELRSQGADPNYSAGPVLGNPILIISGVIAILVLLGGKGYFY